MFLNSDGGAAKPTMVDLNPFYMLVFFSMGMFTMTLALYFILTDGKWGIYGILQ